jgi:hypothetical protein
MAILPRSRSEACSCYRGRIPTSAGKLRPYECSAQSSEIQCCVPIMFFVKFARSDKIQKFKMCGCGPG